MTFAYSYRDLLVWQKSVDFCGAVYQLSQQLPSEEKFGLKSQVERSAESIASNIAEGKMRRSKKDFVQFLKIAL